MHLKHATIKKIMRSSTSRQVSSHAVFVMAVRVEKFIKDKTAEADRYLDEQNKLRKQQGVYEKRRLSGEEVFEVAKW